MIFVVIMKCVIVQFVISVNLIVVSTLMELEPSEIEQEFQWSVFGYEQEFKSYRNWNGIFCSSTRRPASIFLEVYVTNRSHEIQRFLNIFSSNLYNSQPRCINAIVSSSFVMEYGETENINSPWLRTSDDSFFHDRMSSAAVPQVESFVFNHPIMARVMIMPLTKINFFMEHAFNHWNRNQYLVIFIILNDNHELTDLRVENIEEILINIARNILETLWEKHGLYNVFIGFPLWDDSKTKLWSYDPFRRDHITQPPGKIVEIDPSMPPNPTRLHNLQGYKLNIGLFETKLTAEIQSAGFHSKHYPNIEDFHGVDGYMVQTMSKHFNFTVDIVPPFGGIKYGHVENGIAVGTLGDVAYRRIHASFNSQYIKDYIVGNQQFASLLNIEFTIPVDWDSVCIIVPSSEEIPRWLRTLIYMQPAIWLCLLIAIILATIAWHLLRNYHHSAARNYSKCDKNYLIVFIDTFMLIVGAPVRSTNVLGERILVGALALLGLTVMGAFSGTLYHSFTNDMYYRPIETLKELDDSGLFVATSSPNLEDIFGPKYPINKPCTCSRLAHKIKSLPKNLTAIKLTAFDRNIAAISREKVFLIEQHQYVDPKGRSLLHLVPDCPQAYYLAYLMPANSIFLESFNSVIRALKEGGVTLFWNKNEIQKSIYAKIKSMNTDERYKVSNGPKPFSIKDMELCFLILAFGLSLSMIVFIVEWIDMVKFRLLRRRQRSISNAHSKLMKGKNSS